MSTLERFDAFEVHPVAYLPLHPKDMVAVCKREAVEICEEEDADFWSVYGHLPEGGVRCLADCDSKEGAEYIKAALESVTGRKAAGPYMILNWGFGDSLDVQPVTDRSGMVMQFDDHDEACEYAESNLNFKWKVVSLE
ncbi:MAG: hypothetical protein VST71_06705 [Nitrospirota bacterium]|nr:hypothetical protein [Nitrospirota bacterium]